MVCEAEVIHTPQPVYIQLSSLIPPEAVAPRVVVLPPSVFNHPIRKDILNLCVVHYLDGLRQGTAATKSRGEVRGSGRKIRPQKGSGRARLGDGQSPMLRGGGHAFAKKARDFSTKLPRKVIQMGMRVALSAKVSEDALGVVESLDWPSGKTRQLEKRIEELGWQKTLLVTGSDTVSDTLVRSCRALDYIKATTAASLNIHETIKWERIVLDFSAIEFFERNLKKPEIDALVGM
ncbi:ribosomal protein L4 [Hysterangium stoloniferum]|nr:ribosomal protein L4 [Hysterangium stoloniferum]